MLLALAAAATAAGPAAAGPAVADEPLARAEILFQEGLRLLADDRAAEACPKLEESQRLDPALGTEFRLAECYEAIGRAAGAWALFVDVADRSGAQGMGPQRQKARLRAAVIEPRLMWLTVVVPAQVARLPGLAVTCDGSPLGQASWGLAVPVDAGAHTIDVTAAGRIAYRSGFEARAPGDRFTVRVPTLAVSPPGLATAPGDDRGSPRSPPSAREKPTRTAALALVGVGGASLLAGSILGAVALQRNGVWKEQVAAEGCTASHPPVCGSAAALAIQKTERERSLLATGSTAGFVLGAAAGAGALATWLLVPRARVEVGPRGVAVHGSF